MSLTMVSRAAATATSANAAGMKALALDIVPTPVGQALGNALSNDGPTTPAVV